MSRLTKAPMRSPRSSTSYDLARSVGPRPRTSKTPPNNQCDGLSRAWASEKMNRRLKSSRVPRQEFHPTQSSHERARTSIGYFLPFHTAQWSLHTVGSRSPMRLLSGITAATLAKLLQSLTEADIENLSTGGGLLVPKPSCDMGYQRHSARGLRQTVRGCPPTPA